MQVGISAQRRKTRPGRPIARSYSVADACRAYVQDRLAEKGEACARDAQQRFERTVYGREFGAIELRALRTAAIKAWREGLGLSRASANRTLTSLRAALNLAVTNRLLPLSAAREWRAVKPYLHADRRRELFLDIAQRRALLSAASGAIRELLAAATLTGARPGELVRACVGQFDARTRTMRFVGKTGPRIVPLSAQAVALFERLAAGHAPADRLLVRDDGKPWCHSDWDEPVRRAAQRAGLPPGVCLYTLRHSFITQAICDGLTTLEVARLVGTSLTMIDRHYGHLVMDASRERLGRVQLL